MKSLITLIFILVLTGCASKVENFGYYSPLPIDQSEKIATDICKQLTAIYPPATTKLSIKQEDNFKHNLVNSLRKKGYSIVETQENIQKETVSNNAFVVSISLSYTLDFLDNNSYRVSVYVGNYTLNTLYFKNSKELVHSGVWSKGQQL